jgi:hypothetical protein
MDASLQRHGCPAMPEIVQPDRGSPIFWTHSVKPRENRSGATWSRQVTEHKIMVGPACPHQQPLSSLPRTVLAKRCDSPLVEPDRTPTARCLRCAKHDRVSDHDHGLPDGGPASVKVEILPAQPQRFAAPQSVVASKR